VSDANSIAEPKDRSGFGPDGYAFTITAESTEPGAVATGSDTQLELRETRSQ